MDITEHYKVKQNCFDDLIVLREAWGHLSFTIQQAGHGYKLLTIMWLYCPPEIQYLIDATLSELERRCQLMGMPEYKEHYHLQENEHEP